MHSKANSDIQILIIFPHEFSIFFLLDIFLPCEDLPCVWIQISNQGTFLTIQFVTGAYIHMLILRNGRSALSWFPYSLCLNLILLCLFFSAHISSLSSTPILCLSCFSPILSISSSLSYISCILKYSYFIFNLLFLFL